MKDIPHPQLQSKFGPKAQKFLLQVPTPKIYIAEKGTLVL